MHASKPLIFDVPAIFSFGFLCKLHRATHVFRVRRVFRGNRVRELLVEYFGGLQQPRLGDFELAEEELGFDPPLIYLMRSQVCSVHLVSRLAEGEHARIWEHCEVQGERLMKEMWAIEAGIRLGLEGGKVGLEGQTSFVVNKSVENETFAASLPKKPVVEREKVRLGSRKVGENKSEVSKADVTKPSQAAVVTKVGKISCADALKHQTLSTSRQMKTNPCSIIPVLSFCLSFCTMHLLLSNQKRNAETQSINHSISLSKNLKQRLHSAPHSNNSLLLTNLRINNPRLTRPQVDPIRVPPRLLLTTEPLAQLLDLVRMCSLVLDLNVKNFDISLDGSLQTEACEEDDLQVRDHNCLVGVVAEVLGVAAVEVDLLEFGPGGGHGELGVCAAHGFPAGVVGVEEFLEGCE